MTLTFPTPIHGKYEIIRVRINLHFRDSVVMTLTFPTSNQFAFSRFCYLLLYSNVFVLVMMAEVGCGTGDDGNGSGGGGCGSDDSGGGFVLMAMVEVVEVW
ncbi:hypothetical protein HanRHA438_Chr15g0722671 [Helianthus annuus]|nr:hypothetical protein HanRHA438_Chr15g0722671 [Helianthus annuus]